MQFQTGDQSIQTRSGRWAIAPPPSSAFFSLALLRLRMPGQSDPVPQFGVTAANAQGNALYNVTLTPNATPNTGALITGTTRLNTTTEAWRRMASSLRVVPCSQLPSPARSISSRRGLIEL